MRWDDSSRKANPRVSFGRLAMKRKSWRWRLAGLFGGLLMASCVTWAAAQAETAEREYWRLWERAKRGLAVDFHRMRWLFTKTKHYLPTGYPIKDGEKAMRLLREGKCKYALPQALSVLETYYVSVQAHFVAAVCYHRAGKPRWARFHGWTYSRLIRSILDSGDGRSPKTAYRVISMPEVMAAAAKLKLPRGGFTFFKRDDRLYAAFASAKHSGRVYFDVTAPLTWKPRPVSKSKDPRAGAKLTPEDEYARLVMRAKAGDRTVNFNRMRWLFTKTPDFAPKGREIQHGRFAMRMARAGGCAEALPIALRILETYYVSVQAHFVASICYEQNGSVGKSVFHKQTYFRLVRSITNERDGRTPATAYRVINIPEVFAVASVLRLQRDQARFLFGSDNTRLFVIPDKNGRTIYFDVTLPYSRDLPVKPKTP
jgi:hypothetical protein